MVFRAIYLWWTTTLVYVNVKVRLFATLRERADRSEFEIELADGTTAGAAVTEIAHSAGFADLLGRLPLVVAINREYAGDDELLSDGDELALIPPVSGGAGPATVPSVHARIVSEPLSADRVTALVADPGAGATVVFHGTTRDVTELEYEAYAEMAQAEIERILRAVIEQFEVLGAAAEHRTGIVPLGESSVIVAVSAAHRGAAFDGARAAIDRIKEMAPIWKVEVDVRDAAVTRTRVEGTLPNVAENRDDPTNRTES